jgi:hypothetical protein
MSNTDRSAINCPRVEQALPQARALTPAEAAHLESCNACLEAWLDATVTHALDAKPEVRIPADFAVRVTAKLPAKRNSPVAARRRTGHWGLFTAALLIAVGLLVAVIADPAGLSTRTGAIFMLLVASEVAAIALWLGTARPGERRSR